MDLNRLQQILDRAPSKRITVIGDLMLDEFVWGKVGRISPEAPVPVVEVTGESFYPGGAANVARNLREFVQGIAVIGMLGKDRSGQQLRELLTAQNIDTSNAIEDETLSTIVKTRIIALHQQVVRVDRAKIVTPSPEQIAKDIATVRAAAAKYGRQNSLQFGMRLQVLVRKTEEEGLHGEKAPPPQSREPVEPPEPRDEGRTHARPEPRAEGGAHARPEPRAGMPIPAPDHSPEPYEESDPRLGELRPSSVPPS